MFADQLGQIDRLMTLPQVVQQINSLVESKTASAADLHRVIKADPALSARLLKLVNSAYYGLPGCVGSLEKAVILLGVTAVKNLAMAASVEQLFRNIRLTGLFSGQDMWMHCLAVAAAARDLGQKADVDRLDEVFMAGLLHDLGLLAAAQVAPKDLAHVADVCSTSQQPWHVVELEILGIDHGAAGSALAEKWHFPPEMVEVIAIHHQWTERSSRAAELARLVYLADTLACQLGDGFYLCARHQTIGPEMLATVGLSQDQVSQVWQELPSHMDELSKVLRV